MDNARTIASPDELMTWYQCLPYRAKNTAPGPLPERDIADHEGFVAAWNAADPEVRDKAALLILAEGAPWDRPLAVNGIALGHKLPPADEALAFLAGRQDWFSMSDEGAEEIACDVQEAMAKAGYPGEAIPGAWTDIVAAAALENPREAQAVVHLLYRHLEAAGAPPLLKALTRSLNFWVADRILERMEGKDIADMRKRGGLIQEELAEAVGVSKRHVVRLEKGETAVSTMLARRIAKACRQAIEERKAELSKPL